MMTQHSKFYQAIAYYYDDIFPLRPAVVEFVCLQKNGRNRLLDIGCATGALISELEPKGFVSTGIDIDTLLLQQAQRRLHTSTCHSSAKLGDMHQLDEMFDRNAFDIVTCLGNTLSHVDIAAIEPLFFAVHRRLGSTGIFCGQIINYPNMIRQNITQLPTIENARLIFERTYHIKDLAHPFEFEAKLIDKTSLQELTVSQNLYPWTQSAIGTALKTAGFQSAHFYSGFDASPESDTALPLIFVAKK